MQLTPVIKEIKGRRFTQAMYKFETGIDKKAPVMIPVYDNDGEPVYAIPGGGRATEQEISE